MKRRDFIMLVGGAAAWLAAQFVTLPAVAQEAQVDEPDGLPYAQEAQPDEPDSLPFRLLGLFSEVFERIRTDYVTKPDDWKLVEDAIGGMLQATNLSSAIDKNEICAREIAIHDTYNALICLGAVFEQIRTNSSNKVLDAKIIDSAIQAMTGGLDSRSYYISGEMLRDVRPPAPEGGDGSIGVALTVYYGRIQVMSAIGGSTGAKAGIQAGDIIADIDRQPADGITLEHAHSRLGGPIGTIVRLRILRKGMGRPIDFAILRDRVWAPSVNATNIENVCYIQLTRFHDKTIEALREAIRELQTQNAAGCMKGYVLDLRNNSGGMLDSVISGANAFLDKGEITSLRGRSADDKYNIQRYNAHPNGDLTHGKPLIVLVNGGTASGAEIVAGALQDHRRATLVGTRSFGAASVQTILPLGQDKGQLRITTSFVYTPASRNLTAKWIAPDIEVRQDAPRVENLRSVDDGLERIGLQSYIPANPVDDKALHFAVDLLRGVVTNEAFPRNSNALPPG
jgi:carboxyl-terminal processing protease